MSFERGQTPKIAMNIGVGKKLKKGDVFEIFVENKFQNVVADEDEFVDSIYNFETNRKTTLEIKKIGETRKVHFTHNNIKYEADYKNSTQRWEIYRIVQRFISINFTFEQGKIKFI